MHRFPTSILCNSYLTAGIRSPDFGDGTFSIG